MSKKVFKSEKDLIDSVQKDLNKGRGNYTSGKKRKGYKGGGSLIEVRKAAEKLQKEVQNAANRYYNSVPYPKYYERTYALGDTEIFDYGRPYKTILDGVESMAMDMHMNDNAMHSNAVPSLGIPHTHDVNAAMLINEGWKTFIPKNPLYVGYRGSHYLEEAVERFNAKFAKKGYYAKIK